MNVNDSIFEVSRADYQGFVEIIKPEFRNVETIDLDKWHVATKIFSKKTNKCLCSRVTYTGPTDEDTHEPERYYIFEMPEDEERQPPTPKRRIVLESKEEVQAFINGLSLLQKEGKL